MSDTSVVLENLTTKYHSIFATLSERKGKQELLLQSLSAERLQRQNTEESLIVYQNAKKLLELFVKSTEYTTKNYIEPIVTEALEFVFSQTLFFHIKFEKRRNQVEIDFIITRTQEAEDAYLLYEQDPDKYVKELEQLVKDSKNINYMYGGAVNQVISVVLIFALSETFQIKGPIVLDEPSSAVSEKEYSARLGQLISSFSERFQRQYILITHSTTLASFSDKIYEVYKVNDISKVKEIKI